MRWMIALLFLAACTVQLAVQVPQQYAVHESGQYNISYVVRDGRYVACQGEIAGERCTAVLLDLHGLRMEDIARSMAGARNESGCVVRGDARACFDEFGAITSYTDGNRIWAAQYVTS